MEPARPALPQARTDASALTPASPADAGREPPPDPVHPGLPEQGQDGRVHPVSAPPRPAPEGLAGVTHAPEGALGGQHAAPSGPHGAAGGKRAAAADAAVALRAVGTRPGTVSSRYDLEGQTEQVHDLAATPTHRSDAQRCHTHPGCSSISLSFLRLGDLVSSQHLFRGWGSRWPGAGVTWICPHSLQTDQVAPLPWAPPSSVLLSNGSPLPAWPCRGLQSVPLPALSPASSGSSFPGLGCRAEMSWVNSPSALDRPAGSPTHCVPLTCPQVPADPAPEPGLPGHDRRLQPEHAVPAPRCECPGRGGRGPRRCGSGDLG